MPILRRKIHGIALFPVDCMLKQLNESSKAVAFVSAMLPCTIQVCMCITN